MSDCTKCPDCFDNWLQDEIQILKRRKRLLKLAGEAGFAESVNDGSVALYNCPKRTRDLDEELDEELEMINQHLRKTDVDLENCSHTIAYELNAQAACLAAAHEAEKEQKATKREKSCQREQDSKKKTKERTKERRTRRNKERKERREYWKRMQQKELLDQCLEWQYHHYTLRNVLLSCCPYTLRNVLLSCCPSPSEWIAKKVADEAACEAAVADEAEKDRVATNKNCRAQLDIIMQEKRDAGDPVVAMLKAAYGEAMAEKDRVALAVKTETARIMMLR